MDRLWRGSDQIEMMMDDIAVAARHADRRGSVLGVIGGASLETVLLPECQRSAVGTPDYVIPAIAIEITRGVDVPIRPGRADHRRSAPEKIRSLDLRAIHLPDRELTAVG